MADPEPERPLLPPDASRTQIVAAINVLARTIVEMARAIDDTTARQEQVNQRLAPFLQRLATALDGKP